MRKHSAQLVDIFPSERDDILHAARANFEYAYRNGPHTLDDLASIFHEVMPVIEWQKSSVRCFLYPDAGKAVALRSATNDQITSFLGTSIKLRDQIQNEWAAAQKMIQDARTKWGDMADQPPQRKDILERIRENLRYVRANGSYTFEKLAQILKKACPDYAWDKSSARRFIEPETGQRLHEIALNNMSAETIRAILETSINLRHEVMASLSVPEGTTRNPDGPQ